MTEWLNLSVNFAVFTAYFVAFSGCVYGLTLLAERQWVSTLRWRGFWIVAAVCCLLPLLVALVPEQRLPAPLVELPDFAGGIEEGATFVAATARERAWPDLGRWLSFAWLFTVVGVCAWRLVSALHGGWQLRALVARAQPVQAAETQPLAESATRLLRRLQRRTGLDIRITDQRCSPFVVGVFKPRLVISRVALQALSVSQFSLMLRHELTHVSRADLWLANASQLLRCLCWFNPFLLRLLDQMHWAAEASCDSAVLAHKPSAATTYAHAMLNVLRATCQPSHNRSQPMAVAFIHHTRRTTTMRMQWILSAAHAVQHSWTQRLATLCGIGALAAGAFLLQPGFAVAGNGERCKYMNPVAKARVSSSYGQKEDRFHNGYDLAINKGAPVVAAGDGKVIISTDVLGKKVNYGKIIVIEHKDGLKSLYSHLDSRAVEKGQWVNAGQKIGEVGETGKATGPHLHFEMLKGKERVNPADYVTFPDERKHASLRLPPVM